MGIFNEKHFGSNNKQQTSIDNMLRPNETVIKRLKPNKTAFVMSNVLHNLPFTLIWLAFDTLAIIALFAGGGTAVFENFLITLFILAFFAVHLTPVWLWLIGVIKSTKSANNAEYILTDQRILIKEGINTIDTHSLNYAEIYSINIRIGYLDSMLKVGDLYITADTQSVVLFDIPNPQEIAKLIQETAKNQSINYLNNGRPSIPASY